MYFKNYLIHSSFYHYMAKSKGQCKICGHYVTVGGRNTPPDIAAEGVMESIQEHIFQEHCDNEGNIIEEDYDNIRNAWE